MATSVRAIKKRQSAKGWSCFPGKDDSFHVIVFAPSGPRARFLCSQSDQEFPSVNDWTAKRFREADGLSQSGCIWWDSADAPEQHMELASTFWYGTASDGPLQQENP